MAAVASIVLADALATPVNHTFVPLGPDPKNPSVWWFEDQSGVAAIGYNRISLSLSRPSPAVPAQKSVERNFRVKIRVYTPSLETLGNNSAGFTPAPTISYTCTVTSEYMISERATLQNRKDLLKYSVGLLSNAQLVAMVETLQNIY